MGDRWLDLYEVTLLNITQTLGRPDMRVSAVALADLLFRASQLCAPSRPNVSGIHGPSYNLKPLVTFSSISIVYSRSPHVSKTYGCSDIKECAVTVLHSPSQISFKLPVAQTFRVPAIASTTFLKSFRLAIVLATMGRPHTFTQKSSSLTCPLRFHFINIYCLSLQH